MNESNNIKNPQDTPLVPIKLKLENESRLFRGHLNINSLAGKFDQLKLLIKNNIIILVLTETKYNSSFPDVQVRIEIFSIPFRLDRHRFGGGVLIYVREDMPLSIIFLTICREFLSKLILKMLSGFCLEPIAPLTNSSIFSKTCKLSSRYL